MSVCWGSSRWPDAVRAQPSGGPYGPVAQTYEVPKDAAHVYYVAPDGKADAAATLDAPSTLEAVMPRVVTGDAIILRGGTYRTGGLVLNQGITMQPYRDEVPVLKGTQIAAKWETLRGGVWRTPWKTLFPQRPADWWQRNREGMRTPLHRFNNDMVFVDGEFLQSAGWEGALDAHSYAIDYEGGYVYIGVDPKDRLVEVTAFDSAIVRTTKPVHGKDVGQEGVRHPRDHVHAVRVPRPRGAGHRTGRPGGPGDLRQGRRRHDPRGRDDHLLLARGRVPARGWPRHPPVTRQRHQHRGYLHHLLV